MQIGIAYAGTERQIWLSLEIPEGSTLLDALEHSGVLQRFPEIDLNRQKVGIYGKIAKLNVPLNEGDRVEIYRPITADPKTVPQRKLTVDDDDDDDDD